MSTHRIEVVRVPPLEPHPNADSLSLMQVWGFTVVGRTESWLVPTDRTEFAFLGACNGCAGGTAASKKKDVDGKCSACHGSGRSGRAYERTKVKKLRGILSMGLLVPAPPGSQEGDDVMALLGVLPYEPPVTGMSTGGQSVKGPDGWRPTYDIENWRRYAHVFEPGEMVYVSCKLHGCSYRAVYQNGELHVGSRTEWKKPGVDIWWKVLEQNPWIEEWCRSHEGWTLYGEAFGQVQSIKYAAKPGQLFFRSFDVWDGGRWLDVEEFFAAVPEDKRVPTISIAPYDPSIEALAEGKSLLADNIREGIVIKPMKERTHPEIGRVVAKIVSSAYLAM